MVDMVGDDAAVPPPPRGPIQPFPIVEAFGYAADADTPASRKARERLWCRFSGVACEKFKQYGFGYCSVTYAAAVDEAVRRTYAVCDHRLDGAPIRMAVADHFGDRAASARLVPEVVLTEPRTSFDYVAITVADGGIIDGAIAIETQAIDIRGGGVGPAWRAWMAGEPHLWREHFTRDAAARNRRDTVAYGVNMANIYKRLGLQIAVKGSYLKGIGVPFYVVMQHRPFEYLRRRIAFAEVPDRWDITFMTFEYTGTKKPDGSVEFAHAATVRTSLANYVQAMTGVATGGRADFLERVKRKAGLAD